MRSDMRNVITSQRLVRVPWPDTPHRLNVALVAINSSRYPPPDLVLLAFKEGDNFAARVMNPNAFRKCEHY